MWSPRRGSQSRPGLCQRQGHGLAVWAALAVGGMLPSTGCQVEYAGMTLPSGKYMHDDVQYFSPGTDFPWANTQAATQRARMQQMGVEVPPPGTGGPLTVTPAPGGVPGVQFNQGRPTNINSAPMGDIPGGEPGVPAAPAPAPPDAGGNMPAPAPGGAGESPIAPPANP